MEPREFRIGDRVRLRVPSTRPHWNHVMLGDVIGADLTVDSNDGRPDILVGWQDGSQSWELPIELRLASDA